MTTKARRQRARAAAFTLVATVLPGLGGCTGWPWSPAKPPTDGRSASGHSKEWMDPSNPTFHGTIVKEAGNDFAKAKWNGLACSACHPASDKGKSDSSSGPPSCAACHAGGPDGSPGHPGGWLDVNDADFHGSVLKAEGFDFTKAKAGGLSCSACHAGESPGQASPMLRAPNCFACHDGGPDGSAAHPPGYASPAAPIFHGAAVVAAGYDYRKAMAGGLPCSACHAGESPSQPSPNSRAPSCFPCHVGGPGGDAGHPVGWGFLTGSRAGTAVWTCAMCHPQDLFEEPGNLAIAITLREDPGVWPSPVPSATPSATPSAAP